MYRSHVGPVELHDFIGSYCLDLLIGLGLKKHHKLLDAVYYDINQFIKIAESYGYRAIFLNKNEQQFFGSRMIFMLNKMIKFI